MLQNLNQLALDAQSACKQYGKHEFVFSNDFKERFNKLVPGTNIVFQEYTSIVTSANGLIIIIPNQWFVLASFFSNYLLSLKSFKELVVTLHIDKAKIEEYKIKKVIDNDVRLKITTLINNTEDKELFIRFLTDYSWWFGSKTIDRPDYYISAVLSLAGVIQNSQTYIAELATALSGHQELIEMVAEDCGLNFMVVSSVNALNQIIFEGFKYVLNQFGDDKVLIGHEIKKHKRGLYSGQYEELSLGKHFGSEKLLRMYDRPAAIEELSSNGLFKTTRITVLGNPNTYFSNQWHGGTGNNKNLSLDNFNKFLFDVSNGAIEIIKQGKRFCLINNQSSVGATPVIIVSSVSSEIKSHNTILFGSPGTGKSHKANKITNGKNVYKVTFHPDYDYNSFVGSYKPTMDGDKIVYKFVPQIFTKVYIAAWQNRTLPFYLQIEEINRGNCAEIFGDFFQLLDRDPNGFSKYAVDAEEELYKYLLSDKGFGEVHEGIKDGKLRFPSNLSIIATMNTSDQSLFPMDSAFKRRWDWEYVPINLNCSDSNFTIKLNDNTSFKWLEFLGKINEVIFEVTESQDKQIGNWFINACNSGMVISETTFINKVIFYLWNDVFKDEEKTIFKDKDGKRLTYASFFESNSSDLVLYLLKEHLKLTDNMKKPESDMDGDAPIPDSDGTPKSKFDTNTQE